MTASLRGVGMLALGLSVLVTGCTAAPAPAVTLEDVARERVERLDARVEVLLESHAGYLQSRWPDIVLPNPPREAWLEPGQWQNVFSQCVERATPEGADSRALDVATYTCEARFPPPSLAVNEPGPLEREWVSQYWRSVLPSCLRRSGVIVPPLPEGSLAMVADEAAAGWDPYREIRDDAVQLARLTALCPPPSSVLSSVPRQPVGAAAPGVP